MKRRGFALFVAAFLVVATGALGFAYGMVGPSPDSPDTAGPPISYPAGPPPASHHVLLVGTSLTSRGDWPGLLQDRLSACAGRRVRVERLALAGASSNWGRKALEARLADRTAPRPGLVVIEFSINDASLLRGVPLFQSRRNHLDMLQLVRASGASAFLATRNPAFGWKAAMRPGQSRYQALYRTLARQQGAGLIDSIPEWRALAPATRHALLPDGLHPTPAAMETIAVPALEDALGPLLCLSPSPSPAPSPAPSSTMNSDKDRN